MLVCRAKAVCWPICVRGRYLFSTFLVLAATPQGGGFVVIRNYGHTSTREFQRFIAILFYCGGDKNIYNVGEKSINQGSTLFQDIIYRVICNKSLSHFYL